MNMGQGLRSLSAAVLIFAIWALPAHAIRVCYDYVYYRMTEFIDKTGVDPNPPGSPPGYLDEKKVTDYLGSKQYYPMTTQPAGDKLKKGDVIVVSGHVGFVNGPNDIDHYIQIFGESRDQNLAYPARNLRRHEDITFPPLPPGVPRAVGGLYKNHNLDAFLGAPYQRPASYQVWRKCESIMLLGVCSGG